MTLIAEIRDDIINPKVRLSVLLRKAKVLAHRLKSREFESWVDSELNGYTRPEDLPNYRIISCESFGYFAGTFQRILNNAPIVTSGLPDSMKNEVEIFASKLPFFNGVRELESITEQEDKSLKFSWPSNLTATIADQIYGGFVCVSAWRHCSVNQIVGILDTTRNRLLSFILELEELSPDAGEEREWGKNSPSAETVTHLFITNMYGNMISIPEAKVSANFDLRGQVVNSQYIAGEDINVGAVQTADDVVSILEHLQASLALATKDGDADNEAVIDADANLRKAVAQAKKPQPDKNSIIERLNQAKAALEGVATGAKVVSAIAAAVPAVQKLLQG